MPMLQFYHAAPFASIATGLVKIHPAQVLTLMQWCGKLTDRKMGAAENSPHDTGGKHGDGNGGHTC